MVGSPWHLWRTDWMLRAAENHAGSLPERYRPHRGLLADIVPQARAPLQAEGGTACALGVFTRSRGRRLWLCMASFSLSFFLPPPLQFRAEPTRTTQTLTGETRLRFLVGMATALLLIAWRAPSDDVSGTLGSVGALGAGAPAPPVLLFDDLHCADYVSLRLLSHLVEKAPALMVVGALDAGALPGLRPPTLPLPVAAATATATAAVDAASVSASAAAAAIAAASEPGATSSAPGSEGQHSAGLLRSLMASPGASVVELGALQGDAVSDLLLDALLGAEAPPAVRALVAEQAGGNPFFVKELVALLVKAGFVVKSPSGAGSGSKCDKCDSA